MDGLPYVIHPTDRPNYCEVVIGDLTMYFSYRTCIAYAVPGQGLVARVNDWGPTTGKHLAEVGVDKADRIPGTEFEARLRAIVDRMRTTV